MADFARILSLVKRHMEINEGMMDASAEEKEKCLISRLQESINITGEDREKYYRQIASGMVQSDCNKGDMRGEAVQ